MILTSEAYQKQLANGLKLWFVIEMLELNQVLLQIGMLLEIVVEIEVSFTEQFIYIHRKNNFSNMTSRLLGHRTEVKLSF